MGWLVQLPKGAKAYIDKKTIQAINQPAIERPDKCGETMTPCTVFGPEFKLDVRRAISRNRPQHDKSFGSEESLRPSKTLCHMQRFHRL